MAAGGQSLLAVCGQMQLATHTHRMRSLLDEVLGPENFITTMIWQKIHARSH